MLPLRLVVVVAVFLWLLLWLPTPLPLPLLSLVLLLLVGLIFHNRNRGGINRFHRFLLLLLLLLLLFIVLVTMAFLLLLSSLVEVDRFLQAAIDNGFFRVTILVLPLLLLPWFWFVLVAEST